MTHDLLSDMLGELEVECTRVAVTELRENTFYASISLRFGGRDLEIDSRPSDALALAVCPAVVLLGATDRCPLGRGRCTRRGGMAACREPDEGSANCSKGEPFHPMFLLPSVTAHHGPYTASTQ